MLVSLFEKVIGMSLVGTYVIGIVLLVRLLLHKCERKYSYFLWFIVFLNLSVPVSIQAPFSLVPKQVVEVAKLTEHEEAVVPQSGVSQNVAVLDGEVVKVVALPGDLTELQQAASMSSENIEKPLPLQKEAPSEIKETLQEATAILKERINLQGLLSSGWIMGIGMVWTFSSIQIIRLTNKLRKVSKYEIVQKGIVCIESIESPFLWGLFKPTIYLPMNLEEAEKEYIIAHESYHKKRKDYLAKLLAFVVVSIHWFNPLVWVAYALFCKDMEISCDEAVLSHAKEKINKQYAASLLKYAAKQNGFVLTPLTFGEPSVKSRIQNVLRYKKGSIVVTILSICVVSLTACGLMVRTEDEESTEGVNIQTKQEENQQGENSGLPVVENTPTPEDTTQDTNERDEIVLVQDGDYREVKVLWEDLDGNGQQEYIIVQSKIGSAKITVYMNEEPIYTYENPDLRITGIDQREYLDLDNDGEREIFISFQPIVNSRPLEEWFVLKQTDNGWEVMEQYHNEESSSGIDNSFPITVTLYKKPYELMIACEGFDKEIYYNAAKHYEEIKDDLMLSSIYSTWLGNSDRKEGDIVGGTDAWGIWDIKAGEYAGKNCLIAEHGIIGISSWWDNYGLAYVYFNYDAEGKIQILDFVFKEYVSDKTIAATTKPTTSSAQEIAITSKAPLAHSHIQEVAQYTGAVPAYHTSKTSFQKSDGSVDCKIDWMKLNEELILEDLSFDLTMEFIEKEVLTGTILDIFYDEKNEQDGTVSVIVNAYKSNESEGYQEVTWLIQFSPIKPEGATVISYDTQGVWFGEIKYVNGCFYLHSGADTLPYEINPHALSREGRSCEKEYYRAVRIATEFMDNLKAMQGIDSSIHWFSVVGEMNGMTLYQGLVQEEMDTPILAKVYVTTKNGEIMDAWLVEQEDTTVVTR